MNYEITYCNDFSEPYYYSKDAKQCRHIHSESYIVQTLADTKQVVKDFLDIPEKELSIDEVLKDFSSPQYQITAEKAEEIRTYYNGRLKLWNQINASLENVDEHDKINHVYSLPQKINEFTVTDEFKSIQNTAYISIKTTETPI